MFRFQWSKEALNYLKDNQGLINDLELAFAEYRAQGTRTPEQGVVDMLAPLQYLWGIHDHLALFRLVSNDAQWKIRIEVIKPLRSTYDEILYWI